ncbi:dienelactone hydrolase family protein [Ralstonia solanacearum]|uniref:dienelactone hydrolase family protein n=1 Tax=Ralstonia solanacearum TaxID=305 RepID=UPI0005C6F74F|nr:dienelactone hydrolase family protein [Ralstonia solanacearum]MBB6592265.1 dienelactone hydrolase family protein [Ralstonia solanacearum]MBB6596490.1 dienelactone hydrolase family protein [Ralstonia solanacearum]MDB0543933.1 dienelactone hydrolase family protein [Ralstonia solanacearum]MDB0553022.1 dienelactone hydrolase family protein [Ralstonia solanacearum]MDB0558871.1 dienelactone hydrolase family protein [Ralstonia solanacearum]
MNNEHRSGWRRAWAALGCAVLLAAAAHAEDKLPPGMTEQVVDVPKSAGIFTVRLETTIFKPAGDGPFPLIVLNHGKSHGNPAFQGRARYSAQAAALVARGYVVALPMRQGFSKSGGAYIGGGCNVESNGIVQAEDVVATLDYMTQQPYVDRDRIVIMGQSHGGLTTMAFGTLAYPGVRGLVNFAGGLRNDTCVAWEDNLVRAFGNYGKQSHYPSLWFYGDNDSYWPKPLPERLFAAYTSAGGKARLVDYGTFQSDSHGMFGSRAGLGIWLPQVDAFLRELGLPSGPVSATTSATTPANASANASADANKDTQ